MFNSCHKTLALASQFSLFDLGDWTRLFFQKRQELLSGSYTITISTRWFQVGSRGVVELAFAGDHVKTKNVSSSSQDACGQPHTGGSRNRTNGETCVSHTNDINTTVALALLTSVAYFYAAVQEYHGNNSDEIEYRDNMRCLGEDRVDHGLWRDTLSGDPALPVYGVSAWCGMRRLKWGILRGHN
ncbi:hypothetical protein AKJ16_DCAP19628, partial [Drosera capensis]